jgi:hypothetical protein
MESEYGEKLLLFVFLINIRLERWAKRMDDVRRETGTIDVTSIIV